MSSPYIYDILFANDQLVVINKPYGHVVHRSKLVANADEIILQNLKEQIGQYIYPFHRLDRKTTGVLAFGLTKEYASICAEKFREQTTTKVYYAIVRGWVIEPMLIDYPLVNEKGVSQEALTEVVPIQQAEIPIADQRFPTSRYTLVKLLPKTGRMHQLRKHMSHIFHPIIGDRPHGCNKQNRLWKNHFDYTEMTLHARFLDLNLEGVDKIVAPFSMEFKRVAKILNFDLSNLD